MGMKLETPTSSFLKKNKVEILKDYFLAPQEFYVMLRVVYNHASPLLNFVGLFYTDIVQESVLGG